MSRGALDRVKLIDYADLMSGPYCTKLLADLGAEVTKIEYPEVAEKETCPLTSL